MTDTSVKEMFERLVDGGAPPAVPLPVDAVLSHNGRVLRRRRFRRSLGVGSLALVVAAVVLLLPRLPAPGRTTPPDDVARPSPMSTASAEKPTPSASTEVPGPTPLGSGPSTNHRRAELMLLRLTQAVPAPYTLPKPGQSSIWVDGVEYGVRSMSWDSDPQRLGRTLAEAMLEVQLDGRAALLSVRATRILSGQRQPVASCAVKMDDQEAYCRMIKTRNGELVRISGWNSPSGPTRRATNFTADTYVVVEQSSRPRPGVFGLGRMVLTDQTLAELATDPGYTR